MDRQYKQVAHRLFVALLLCVAASIARAEPRVDAAPAVFGTVLQVHGKVTANDAAGLARQLQRGAEVRVGERIVADGGGEALLKTADAGLVAVRPNAVFTVEQYSARGTADDRLALRLLVGSLRLVSGWIGKLKRDNYQVLAGSVTIGIRGTDHEPYVIAPESSLARNYGAGTYDRVYRGRTVLGNSAGAVELDAGQVGYARDADARSAQSERSTGAKAMLTLLLPAVLEKVPGFYVPGRFDAEVERYSADSDRLQHEAWLAAQPNLACDAARIANDWLARFDGAMKRRDAQAVEALFAEDATVLANLRTDRASYSRLTFSRTEMVNSALQALQDLQDYRHERHTVEVENRGSGQVCGPVVLRSLVSEGGTLKGAPFHFDSLETFELERQDDGAWRAVKSETTQR